MTQEPVVDCKSEEGIIVGLIDSIMAIAVVAAKYFAEHDEDYYPPAVAEACADLFQDKDLRLLISYGGNREYEDSAMSIEFKRLRKEAEAVLAMRASERDAGTAREGMHPPVADEPAKSLPRLVACAVIIRDGKVLLERRAPCGVDGLDGMWDLPGGKVECGEAVSDCVVREIAEELSVCIRTVRLLPYLPVSDWVYADGERRHWILAAFECELISGEPVCNERLQWFSVRNLPKEMLKADRDLLGLVTPATREGMLHCTVCGFDGFATADEITQHRLRCGQAPLKIETPLPAAPEPVLK